MTEHVELELPTEVESLRREWYSMREQMRQAITERHELAMTLLRVQELLDWGVGRGTKGVDRMIPSSDLRAALLGTNTEAQHPTSGPESPPDGLADNERTGMATRDGAGL